MLAHEGLGDALSGLAAQTGDAVVTREAVAAYTTARDGFAALAGTTPPPASVAGRVAAIDAKLARVTPRAAS